LIDFAANAFRPLLPAKPLASSVYTRAKYRGLQPAAGEFALADTHMLSTPPDLAPVSRQDRTGIVIRDLRLCFGNRVIFSGLNLTVAPGQFVVLLGTSGVGKSSLLKIVAGLAKPQSGRVTTTQGTALAGHIAYMGQTDLLYPWASVLANVTIGARLRGEVADAARAQHLLERVGLAERAGALPGELSGGMRQRAAIARTLYERRPIVLMDEPFSALDTFTRARIQDLAAELLAGRTVLMITHDPLEACRLGHQLVVMSGTPATLAPAITLGGAIPRPPDDPEVLRTQGRLMALLTPQAPE
jgi:putative hydroxymethylpyrimidine transport system ATP-binding protein